MPFLLEVFTTLIFCTRTFLGSNCSSRKDCASMSTIVAIQSPCAGKNSWKMAERVRELSSLPSSLTFFNFSFAVILPPSALDKLGTSQYALFLFIHAYIFNTARLRIDYPMLFEVTGNQGNSFFWSLNCCSLYLGRRMHCGVLEFVADEGTCYLPYWVFC